MSMPASSPRRRLLLAAWTAAFLVVLDLVVNQLFAYPEDPRDTRPTRLQAYFEYGRSVEGKFDAMTRDTDEASAPILTAGWLGPISANEPPSTREPSRRLRISIYGMSHARRLADAVARTSPDVAIRPLTAPAATPNWTYAAYTRDRGRGAGDAVVMSLLSATVPMIDTLSNATAFFDQARPYTQPQYRLENGALHEVAPRFDDVESYRRALHDPEAWGAHRAQLAEIDPYYDPLLYRRSVLDRSALVRVLRRGYATGARDRLQRRVYGREGFREDTPEVALLHALVREFARSARSDGLIPVVYLANSLGYGDHLYRVLAPLLDAAQIPYVSSHTVCSPTDPRCYLPDSHFLPEKDDEIAVELVRVIDDARGRSSR